MEELFEKNQCTQRPWKKSKLDTTLYGRSFLSNSSCPLQSKIQDLLRLDASCQHSSHSTTKFLNIVQSIQSLLLTHQSNGGNALMHMNHVDQTSLTTLRRIFTLRIGSMASRVTEEENDSNILSFLSQIISCWVALLAVWLEKNQMIERCCCSPDNNTELLEKILLIFVQASNQSVPWQQYIHSVLSTLMERTREYMIIYERFKIALHVIEDPNHTIAQQKHQHQHQHQHLLGDDKLFHLQCLVLVSNKRASSISMRVPLLILGLKNPPTTSIAKALFIIEAIVHKLDEKIKNTLATAVARMMLCLQKDLDSRTLITSFRCFASLLVGTSLFLPRESVELLEMCATYVAGNMIDNELGKHAGKVLIYLISQDDLSLSHCELPETNTRILSVVSMVLSKSQLQTTVSACVHWTCKRLHDAAHRATILGFDSNGILRALAAAIKAGNVSIQSKKLVVDVISMLLQSEPMNNDFAREPQVLDALIVLASKESDVVHENDKNQYIRQKALMILLDLSSNPCNQRILAKHSGLLAMMIQFARSSTFNQNNEVSTGDSFFRQNIKRQIFCLAEAL